MLWYSWLMIGIVCVGILYMIADKWILPIYRYHKNKKRAATYVWCTFFHPAGGVPQRMLCKPNGAHFIEPPKEHLDFFPVMPGKQAPLYSLIGTEIIGYNPDESPIEQSIRLVQRDVWPPGADDTEQVLVESAYFIIGRQEALNPYRDFLAINTEKTQLILREERSMESINAQQNRELELTESLETNVHWLRKNWGYGLIGIIVAAVGSAAAAVLSYMTYKQGL